jgi:hypothetical protein
MAGAMSLFAVILSLWAGQAMAEQNAASRTNDETAIPIAAMPLSKIEVVVVWGFRLRSQMSDSRMGAVRQGYGELVEKNVCMNSVCGYVVVKEGDKWRATNVIAATEEDLMEKQANMERESTTLVIVHPTGLKRKMPDF